MPYDVTIVTVRPGTHPKALPGIEKTLKTVPGKGEFLACLYSEIGALNQILLLHRHASEADLAADRERLVNSDNPFGCAEFITGITTDTYHSFPSLPPIQPGQCGPVFEVRTYILKPAGLIPTIEAWRTSLPARAKLSPVLAAMYSTTGAVARFMHIWPYANLDERRTIRAKAIETGVWPPPGGPGHLLTQQTDIFLPAAFSPIR